MRKWKLPIILVFAILLNLSFTLSVNAISCTEYTAKYDCLSYHGGNCTETQQPQMNAQASLSKTILDYGELATVTISVTNNDPNIAYYCSYQLDGSEWSSSIIVSKSDTTTLGTPSIISPTTIVSQQTTKNVNVNVHCEGEYYYVVGCWCSNGCQQKSLSYAYPLASTIQQQQAQAEADSAISTAITLIGEAQSLISSANSKIIEGSSLGADITQANGYLTSANTALSNAQTYLSSAQSSYSSSDYSSAKSSAQQSQTYANNAKNYANQAKSSAEQAIQQVSQEKIQASNRISDAVSAIDTARKEINKTESLINNATIIGMDTVQAEASIATARAKLESAEDYLRDANTEFDSDNYDLTISKANTAKIYAQEAESITSDAYTSLWAVYAVKREAASALVAADAAVSQMSEINTKMDYILRNMEKYGVDVTSTSDVLDETKTSIDSAEDSLSDAKNKLNAGYNSEAVSIAIASKSQADSAYNRLDTLASTLSFSIEDALEEAYNEIKSKLESAKGNVKGAEETYGADPDIIIAAQKDISDAETGLNDAKSKMDLVTSSESITTLVQNSETAFSALEDAELKISSANDKANAAKAGLVTIIGAGLAVAAAAGGGGFLYRRRKKKS